MLDIDQVTERAAMVITAMLMASFAILETITWGRYVYVGLSVAVLLLKKIRKFELILDSYFFFNITLIALAFVSSLWAWDGSLSREIAKRMFDTFLCSLLVYFAYKDEKIDSFVLSCKLSGYIVMAYTIMYYEPRTLLSMLQSSYRMAGEIGNSNVYGMIMAYSCVMEMIELAKKRKLTITCPLMIPAFLVIAATQSRKALLIIGLGIVFVFFGFFLNYKRVFQSLFLVAVSAAAFIMLINLLKQVDLFAGIISRMELLANFAHGGDGVGESLRERSQMIQLGWDQFHKTPIAGIGFHNALPLTMKYNDVPYTYLHNNFIELLCCGGILGFTVYYSRFIYLIGKLIMNIHHDRDNSVTCLILIALILIMDYGTVSYYWKTIQFFQIMLFIQANCTYTKENVPEPVLTSKSKQYKYIKINVEH